MKTPYFGGLVKSIWCLRQQSDGSPDRVLDQGQDTEAQEFASEQLARSQRYQENLRDATAFLMRQASEQKAAAGEQRKHHGCDHQEWQPPVPLGSSFTLWIPGHESWARVV